jgi:hypothetical protein
LIVDEDVDVLPYLTFFIHHAVPQTNVFLPQFIQRFANGRRSQVEFDAVATVSKVSQKTCDVNGNHKNGCQVPGVGDQWERPNCLLLFSGNFLNVQESQFNRL